MEIAVATQTAPAAWWNEPDKVLATVIDVLARNAERMKRR